MTISEAWWYFEYML